MGCGASGKAEVHQTKNDVSDLPPQQKQNLKVSEPKQLEGKQSAQIQLYDCPGCAILQVRPGTGTLYDITGQFLKTPLVLYEKNDILKVIVNNESLCESLSKAGQIFLITDIGTDQSLYFLTRIFSKLTLGMVKVTHIIVSPTLNTNISYIPTSISGYRLFIAINFIDQEKVHFIERGYWYSYGIFKYQKQLDKFMERKEERNYHPDGANTKTDLQLYSEKIYSIYYSRRIGLHILIGIGFQEMEVIEGYNQLQQLYESLKDGTPVMEINHLGAYVSGVPSHEQTLKRVIPLGNLANQLVQNLKSQPEIGIIESLQQQPVLQYDNLFIIDALTVTKIDIENIRNLVDQVPESQFTCALLLPNDSNQWYLGISAMYFIIEYIGLTILLKDADQIEQLSNHALLIDSLLSLNHSWRDLSDHFIQYPRMQFTIPMYGKINDAENISLFEKSSIREVVGINQEFKVLDESLNYGFSPMNSYRVSSNDSFIGALLNNIKIEYQIFEEMVQDKQKFIASANGKYDELEIEQHFMNINDLKQQFQLGVYPNSQFSKQYEQIAQEEE